MNIDTLTLLYIFYFIAIVFYLIAIFLEASFVIPLQFKETGVKNGLKTLRRQLLSKGILSLIVGITSVLALTTRFFGLPVEWNRIIIVIVVVINAIGVVGKAFLDYRIYHQEYSSSSKTKHARIERLEKKEVKREKEAKEDSSKLS